LRSEHADLARQLGDLCARRGIALVTGGGHVGLMGVLADAALSAGGTVMGVIPDALKTKELAHAGLTELRVVATMHERKALMADLADGFAAMAGGFGTADELFEILTWAQLGLHAKPVGLLNVAGYFDPLLAWLDQAVRDGFLPAPQRDILQVATEPDRLLEMLAAYQPRESPPKWIASAER
jgi:uncharacterized protein (TIGR00730 family)